MSNRLAAMGAVVPGDMVEHQSFGEGIIQAVEGHGDKKIAHVHFANAGFKKLLLRYAPVTIAKRSAPANM